LRLFTPARFDALVGMRWVQRCARVAGVERGQPLFADGTCCNVTTWSGAPAFTRGSAGPSFRFSTRAGCRPTKGHRRERAGALLRGAPFLVFGVIDRGSRGGSRRCTDRECCLRARGNARQKL